MKGFRLLVVAALTIPMPAFAAGKPCEELKLRLRRSWKTKE
jgi:hypothetical protein